MSYAVGRYVKRPIEVEAMRRCSMGGASLEETADIMGVTVGTVRRYVKRYRREELR